MADETVMWIIVIFMFMPSDVDQNALLVTHLNDQPLQFSKIEHCYEHVTKNLDGLKVLAREHYGNSPIAKIDCVKKSTEV